MNKKIILFLLTVFALVPGCKKNSAADIKEWAQFQDQFFKVTFNYPKDWVVVTEPKRVIISSSAEAAEKFFDHDSRKADGIQIVIAAIRSDSMQDYTKYIQDFKKGKTDEGFTVKDIEDAAIEGKGAKKVAYAGAYDENTKINSICAATIKDSTIYYIQYSAFNDLFEPYKLVFDSVMASLSLPQKIVIEKGVDPAIPIAQIERYSDNYLQLEYPANFGPSDMPKKGDVMSAVRFMGTTKVSRNDCTIDIDVRPAKKLSLEKVVEQNSKKINATSKGETRINGEKSVYFNETPQRSIERRTYFVVKNDKFYRVMLTYYAPMKKDFLPAFEKVIASIRFK
ncbi:MAG: hypothetical protein EHM64_11390 [Ignavibacteriae bacterium]|nr:MAG: hypothetical protein EHM64_11390 [Ignavibacteriota bacterium]